MKDDDTTKGPPDERPSFFDDDSPAGPYSKQMKCHDIRELLTDYVNRELGDSRSALVREHVRKCPECQTETREIAEALDLLRKAEGGFARMPGELSNRRKRRIGRAYRHPIIGWIEANHVAFSMITAIVLALTIVAALFCVHLLEREDEYYPSVPIRWVTHIEDPGLDQVPVVDDPVPTPNLDPGLSDDPIVPNPMPGVLPDASVASPDGRETDTDVEAHARWIGRLRRDQLFGLSILAAALAALACSSIFFRRRKSGGEEAADGFTEEGPPPLE
jgi:hypothetical protein